MLRPKLPGGVLWTGTQDADGIASEGGIELVHSSPDPFPLLTVQLAPQGWCRIVSGSSSVIMTPHFE